MNLDICDDALRSQRELLSNPKICTETAMNALIKAYGKENVCAALKGEISIAQLVWDGNGPFHVSVKHGIPMRLYECAVEQHPVIVKYMEAFHKNLWMIAVRKDPSLLKELVANQTEDLILEAMKTDVDAVRYIHGKITKSLLRRISSAILDEDDDPR